MDTKPISKIFTLSIVCLLLLSGCNLPAGVPSPTATPTLVGEALPLPTELIPTRPPPTAPPDVPVVVQNPSLTFIDMIDRQTGWGLAETKVLRTRDSGVSWEDVSPGGLLAGGAALSTDFLDTLNGWVLSPNPDGITGTLYATGDGGTSWKSMLIPFSSADLQFLDPLNGWALASLGVGAGSMPVDVYQTTDGGVSWAKNFSSQPGAAETPGALPVAGLKSGLGEIGRAHV